MFVERITLLGVPIDPLRGSDAVTRLKEMVNVEGQHHVMTPNSEMLVEANKNQTFKEVLQKTSLNLPDSVGLLKMAKFTKQHLPERVTGVDTVITLCKELTPATPVFFLGAAEGVAEKAATLLKLRNDCLQIAGAYAGSPAPDEADAIIDRINASEARLLLVAYGAPQQDLWIAEHLHKMPSVRVAMGVGGTFDFIAGNAKRAPVWMQKMGLEWLYRVLKEPKRIRRIWNAVVMFPLLVLRSK